MISWKANLLSSMYVKHTFLPVSMKMHQCLKWSHWKESTWDYFNLETWSYKFRTSHVAPGKTSIPEYLATFLRRLGVQNQMWIISWIINLFKIADDFCNVYNDEYLFPYFLVSLACSKYITPISKGVEFDSRVTHM